MTARNETARNLPVPISPSCSPGGTGRGRARPDAAFTAQLAGAGGERRGLKGGAAALDAARRAYVRIQWSGPADRRIAPGALFGRRV